MPHVPRGEGGNRALFERIHTANLINFGILPLTFKEEKDYERMEQGDLLVLPYVRQRLETGNPWWSKT